MSEEGSFGIALAERFFGLILILVGALSLYYTVTSAGALGGFTGFFSFLCIVLLALGVFLLTAKIE